MTPGGQAQRLEPTAIARELNKSGQPLHSRVADRVQQYGEDGKPRSHANE